MVASRPLADRHALLLAIPQTATQELARKIAPDMRAAVELCAALGVFDEMILRDRLPVLWEHCRQRGWLRASLWERASGLAGRLQGDAAVEEAL